MEKVIPNLNARTVTWGGLQTLGQSHILERLKSDPELEFFPKFEARGPRETIWERCRQALHVDLYMSGTNALTETGILVNLDMWGNRARALANSHTSLF